MGVGGGFWEVVRPVCNSSEDLSVLHGKRLAVDLSFWIVQQESVLREHRVRKPHLRLLFFRVVTLVAKVGAYPIFIVDGDAPLLKLPARLERFSRRSGVPASELSGISGTNNRNHVFLNNVEECVELLKLMGIPVLRATGEAEALCAELERKGIIDACVTPDSDAFLHGANFVIQTLQADLNRPLVEFYLSSDIKSVFNLGREHLIALALLVGCDYNMQGVPGIGYAQAVRLVTHFKEHEILDHLRRWGRHEFPSSEEIKKMNNAIENYNNYNNNNIYNDNIKRNYSHCSKCGHPGNRKVHTKLGCDMCGENIPCSQKQRDFKCSCEHCTQKQNKKKHDKDMTWWTKLAAKISAIPGFPDNQIIELYLNSANHTYLAEQHNISDIQWECPRMDLLEPFLESHLHWDTEYIHEKILPLLSCSCLRSIARGLPLVEMVNSEYLLHGKYAPDAIQKIKTVHTKPFYVVKWKYTQEGEEQFLITEEVVSLVEEACPELVSKFKDEMESKKSLTRRIKKRQIRNQKSIDSFFKKENEGINSIKRSLINLESDEESERNIHASVKRRLFDSK